MTLRQSSSKNSDLIQNTDQFPIAPVDARAFCSWIPSGSTMKRSTITNSDINTAKTKKLKPGAIRKLESSINQNRVSTLYQPSTERKIPGNVIYWMSRDQRTNDNWALIYAAQQASVNKTKLAVVFNLVPTFLCSTKRIHSFMMRGLQEVEVSLKAKGIPMFLLYVRYSDSVFIGSC